MAYLVDSDWFIDYLTGVPEALELLDSLSGDGIAISIVSYMEVYEGVATSPNPKETEERLSASLGSIPLVPFSDPIARRCALLRASLRAQGRRVSSRALDLIVAATALEHGLTLVTRNIDDYHDIQGFTLYRQQ